MFDWMCLKETRMDKVLHFPLSQKATRPTPGSSIYVGSHNVAFATYFNLSREWAGLI